MYPVKQSTALDIVFFAHDSNGDAVTGKVNGDFTKRISKDGAAFAAMTVTISERENGWYHAQLSTSHTDTLGVLSLTFTATGIKQVNLQYRVHARIPDDLAFPTTSGRSLDVTATGAAGIDWGNVENASTAVNLSATNIDVDQVVASVSGSVGSIASGGIAAASFASGAIDNAAIATDAIGSAELAASAITEIQAGLSTLTAAQVNTEVDTALADIRLDELLSADSDIDGAAPPTVGSVFHELLTKTTGSFTYDQTTDSLEAIRDRGDAAWTTATSVAVSAGGITASSFASGAIDAAAIATDAIGSAELAASAITEIQSGLATASALATVQADTDDIQARLPAVLIGGRIDANVGAISGDSTAADNEEAFFDGTGYAGTGNTIPTVTTVTNGVTVTTNNDKTGYTLSNAGIDAVFDRTDGVETGFTLRQVLRLMSAALAGELAGAATTTITIRNITDVKTRITATVDSDGNRSALTYDVT